jgi:hypothetical protein
VEYDGANDEEPEVAASETDEDDSGDGCDEDDEDDDDEMDEKGRTEVDERRACGCCDDDDDDKEGVIRSIEVAVRRGLGRRTADDR